jgi:hypothetical protein
MSLINFSNLDFQQIKTQIIDYLRANTSFTDYDFEGSNLSILIDILAYNTYINSFNANMISNEVFIDSATLRENVVALARNIGYVPRSTKSARASISFLVNFQGQTNIPVSVTLKKGLVCTSSSNIGQNVFSFTVPSDITVPVVNDIAVFQFLEVYEGFLIEESFTYNPNVQDPRIILSNINLDIQTLSVNVRNSSLDVGGDRFILINNLYEAKENANIFFIQEVQDQRYELLFGDGIFGKKLSSGNVIDVSYVVTSGSSANGVNGFSFSGRLVDNNGNPITSGISPIETVSPAVFGEEIESVDSIRKYSTKLYSTQNRAVTAEDYESIIPTIYPEASIVSAYGGETMDPPEYGKVFVAIKPKFGQFLSESDKRNIVTNLRKFAITGINIEIVDIKFLYVEVYTSVYYNPNQASSAEAVRTIVTDTLNKYSKSSELNSIGSRFRYSKLQRIIDDSHRSITSNITNILMRRDLAISANTVASYEICFGNAFAVYNEQKGYNIKSSGFTLDGIDGVVYLGDIPSDFLNTGKVVVFRLTANNETSIIREVGRIDYTKGDIYLFNLNIQSTVKKKDGKSVIEISAAPESNDVVGLKDLFIQMDSSASEVDMIIDNISSGGDISGSTYIRRPSYFDFNKSLTR